MKTTRQLTAVIEREGDGYVARSFFPTDVNAIIAFHARPVISRSSNHSIEIHLIPVRLPHDTTKRRRTQPFEKSPQ